MCIMNDCYGCQGLVTITTRGNIGNIYHHGFHEGDYCYFVSGSVNAGTSVVVTEKRS